MDFSKSCLYLTLLCISGLIRLTAVECGRVLGKAKVENLLVQNEKDHSEVKRFATKEDSIEKDALVKIKSKKKKRDASLALLQKYQPVFPDIQPEYYDPILEKRNTNEDAIATTIMNNNDNAVSGNSNVFETEKRGKSHLHLRHKTRKRNKDDQAPLAIHIEETMGLLTSTENVLPVLEELIPFMPPNEDVMSPDVPYASVFDVWANKNVKSTSSGTIGVTTSNSPTFQDIREQDIGNDLFRLGRNVQAKIIGRAAADDETTVIDTPPVKYEGTLENAKAACIPDYIIAQEIYGPESESNKKTWVDNNKGQICNYNKFLKCLDKDKATTDKGDSESDSDSKKTYCGCILPELIYNGDNCYIPAGTTEKSKCPIKISPSAGKFPGAPVLSIPCTANSECVQRPEFFGSRCICKPNIKFHRNTQTCGNAPNTIFYPIFQVLLVLGALGTIFAL